MSSAAADRHGPAVGAKRDGEDGGRCVERRADCRAGGGVTEPDRRASDRDEATAIRAESDEMNVPLMEQRWANRLAGSSVPELGRVVAWLGDRGRLGLLPVG